MTELEARKALNEAVDAYVAAAGWNDGWIISGWILVVDQLGYDAEGRPNSATAIAYRGGGLPASQSIGLLTLALDSLRGTP